MSSVEMENKRKDAHLTCTDGHLRGLLIRPVFVKLLNFHPTLLQLVIGSDPFLVNAFLQFTC